MESCESSLQVRQATRSPFTENPSSTSQLFTIDGSPSLLCDHRLYKTILPVPFLPSQSDRFPAYLQPTLIHSQTVYLTTGHPILTHLPICARLEVSYLLTTEFEDDHNISVPLWFEENEIGPLPRFSLITTSVVLPLSVFHTGDALGLGWHIIWLTKFSSYLHDLSMSSPSSWTSKSDSQWCSSLLPLK